MIVAEIILQGQKEATGFVLWVSGHNIGRSRCRDESEGPRDAH